MSSVPLRYRPPHHQPSPTEALDDALHDAIADNNPAQVQRLLNEGANPYAERWGKSDAGEGLSSSGLFTVALQRCRPGNNPDPANYIGIPLGLLQMGAAQLRKIEPHFIYFTDCTGSWGHLFTNYAFGSIPESALYATNHWTAERYQAFNLYLMACSSRVKRLVSGEESADAVGAQDLIDSYVVGELDYVLERINWQGHEQHLYALYDRLPPHIAQEIERLASPVLYTALQQIAAEMPPHSLLETPALEHELLQPREKGANKR